VSVRVCDPESTAGHVRTLSDFVRFCPAKSCKPHPWLPFSNSPNRNETFSGAFECLELTIRLIAARYPTLVAIPFPKILGDASRVSGNVIGSGRYFSGRRNCFTKQSKCDFFRGGHCWPLSHDDVFSLLNNAARNRLIELVATEFNRL